MSTPKLTTRFADRYVIGDVIGTGGGSTVHHGFDEFLERPVAVKTLQSAAVETADPAGRRRFLNEARSMAKFHHPHVVRVFDAGEQDGVLYLVMELIEGPTLARVIADRAPLPPDEAVRIIEQVLDALAAVHDAGYVHRDVKPANVLIDRAHHVFLTDFGIAKQMDELEQTLTAMGTVVGTPRYLSPEQAAGAPLGATTDVYATGMLLAELIGVRGEHGIAAPMPSNALGAVVERATQHDPADRYQSASEMAAALRAAGRTETAVLPAVPVMSAAAAAPAEPVTATQAMPVAPPHADDATSIMATAEPVEPDVAGLQPRHVGGLPSPTHRAPRQLPLMALVVGLVLLMLIGVVAGSFGDPLADLPTTPSTLPAPASTVPVAPSVPPPAVPQVTVAPPPPEPAPADPGSGGGGGGRGSGGERGKPDKPGKP